MLLLTSRLAVVSELAPRAPRAEGEVVMLGIVVLYVFGLLCVRARVSRACAGIN